MSFNAPARRRASPPSASAAAWASRCAWSVELSASSTKGVSPALISAHSGADPLSQSAITALIHFVARECFWRVESFDWRGVHRTYHKCFLSKDDVRFVALIGADAPFLALANERSDGRWAFFDDASAASAVRGYYAQSVELLSAQDLNNDLSGLDRAWLEALGEHMRYDLRYWNPGTVGQVVFNFWD